MGGEGLGGAGLQGAGWGGEGLGLWRQRAQGLPPLRLPLDHSPREAQRPAPGSPRAPPSPQQKPW